MIGRMAFSTILVACLATSVQAQETGRPERGRTLALQNCVECHAVQKGVGASPNAHAPRFESIAAVPGMTTIALRAALQTSHRTMPNVTLEPDELADIVAYILSLKNGG